MISTPRFWFTFDESLRPVAKALRAGYHLRPTRKDGTTTLDDLAGILSSIPGGSWVRESLINWWSLPLGEWLKQNNRTHFADRRLLRILPPYRQTPLQTP